MANNLIVDMVQSGFKGTINGCLVFVCIARIGVLMYPDTSGYEHLIVVPNPEISHFKITDINTDAASEPVKKAPQEQIVPVKRIQLGQHTLSQLKK